MPNLKRFFRFTTLLFGIGAIFCLILALTLRLSNRDHHTFDRYSGVDYPRKLNRKNLWT